MTFRDIISIRGGYLLAALWYLLVSTNLAAFAIDKILPRYQTINSQSLPCASHGCGCKHDRESQKGCCCLRITQAKSCALHNQPSGGEESSRRVKLTFLSAARCKGHLGDNAFLLSPLEAHILPVSAGILKEVNSQPFDIQDNSMPFSLFRQPPEKVPLNPLAEFPLFLSF
ncbi:MAG: hypothetical protein A3G37_00655 [Omnitrophica WOR_2 bacterium RIFCSPLOWO2_12_FULL_46_30]|nr:MAG: hypothetical protein A3D27_02900 [Omnitrophica WOR_2 bacterium RIFCSPHIGHO2_02_FULL_46_37]OGX43875.1 MAG: hypothetical protein A3H41_04595 [Omnitrophica WOR_2 bacterium RIFCSPLOWO2_02_FULL_45_28]OGX51284.1 MAG: hypothetical protein A3G37_00655 [Omnitrophica WOR_2 bacterium RIFCSPLOWO2_12_FULL_46_30]